MRSKSYARGNLCVVEVQPQNKDYATGGVSTAIAAMEKSSESLLDDSYETWLRSQAQSIIGKLPTLEEAKQLWQYVDINTRLPFPEPRRPRPLARFLRALRAAGGMNKDSANV